MMYCVTINYQLKYKTNASSRTMSTVGYMLNQYRVPTANPGKVMGF